MATFSGSNSNFTPSTSADNYVLDANTASDLGVVESIGFGGQLITAGAYRTTWARPSTNATSTFTTLTPQAGNPGAAALCQFGTFATVAVLTAEPAGLLTLSWNAFGGIGYITMPINGAWFVVNSATAGAQQIVCRNRAGVDASGSSYSISWRE